MRRLCVGNVGLGARFATHVPLLPHSRSQRSQPKPRTRLPGGTARSAAKPGYPTGRQREHTRHELNITGHISREQGTPHTTIERGVFNTAHKSMKVPRPHRSGGSRHGRSGMASCGRAGRREGEGWVDGRCGAGGAVVSERARRRRRAMRAVTAAGRRRHRRSRGNEYRGERA